MPTSREFTIHLTEDDYAALADYAMRHWPVGRRITRRAWLVGAVAFVAYAATQWNDAAHGHEAPAMYALHLALTAVVIGGLFYFSLRYFPPSLMRVAARSGQRKKSLVPTDVEIDEDGLRVQNEFGHGRILWSSVEAVGETETHIFLGLGRFSAFIIPKRDIDTATAEEILRLPRALN